VSLIVSCDLRSSFGNIRDQGARPTCVAFAVSDAHASARGVSELLSVEHLYFHAVVRTSGGHPNEGVSLTKTLEALRLDGQSVETGWPYLDALPADLTSWVAPSTAVPVFKRDRATRVASILAALDAGQPVVVTFMVSMAFCMAPAGIVHPVTSDTDIDWHAVVAVGHGRIGTKPFILVRNSWGESWGDGGYGWVDLEYLSPRMRDLIIVPSGSTV
jgi:C1A family cysteine protease